MNSEIILKIENPPGKIKEYKLNKNEITIGRGSQCDVVLDDMQASRKHCKIILEGQLLKIVDLKSTNGIFVNNRLVEHTFLKNNDQIKIGISKITVVQKITSVDDKKPGKDEMPVNVKEKDSSESVIKLNTIEEVKKSSIQNLQENDILKKASNICAKSKSLSEKLLKLHLTSYKLTSIFDEDTLLEEIIKVIPLIIPAAQRGKILIYSRDNLLKTKKEFNTLGSECIISNTIINKSAMTKSAILSIDTQEDDRFSNAQSIMKLGIKSVMCVPIIVQEKTYGFIYLDTLNMNEKFSEEDLSLLALIANQSALSLTNISLITKIKNESIMQQYLKQYFSPQIIDKILKSENEVLNVKEYTVSIMFVDIKGFVQLTKMLDSNILIEMLNDFFDFTTEIILRNQGTVDKYIGDAVMAIFGAPEKFDDHADKAIVSALEIKDKAKEFSSKWVSQTNDFIELKIGINSGKALVGNIGAKTKKQYTAIGDTVNIANVITEKAIQNQILISEKTFNSSKINFATNKQIPFSSHGIGNINTFEIKGRF